LGRDNAAPLSKPTATSRTIPPGATAEGEHGLLLVGLSFYWQQVVDGVLISLVLALSFSSRNPG
jgi:hypothetical protein